MSRYRTISLASCFGRIGASIRRGKARVSQRGDRLRVFPNRYRSACNSVLLSVACVLVVLGGTFGATANYVRDADPITRDAVLVTPSEYGLDYSPVSFLTSDGLDIRGWWIGANHGAPVIIFLHGFRGNRATPADRVFGIARVLHANGYNILMFDFRAQGESEGTRIPAGLYETDDVLSAIRFIRNMGEAGQIGVIGFSMGAATALLAAEDTDQIKAVVADSSFSDVLTVAREQFEMRRIPSFLLPVGFFLAKVIYGVNFALVRPIEALKNLATPVFVIHGGKDTTVPVDEAYALASELKSPASKFWVVPEAEHTDAYIDRPQEYSAKLLAFFGSILKPAALALPSPG